MNNDNVYHLGDEYPMQRERIHVITIFFIVFWTVVTIASLSNSDYSLSLMTASLGFFQAFCDFLIRQNKLLLAQATFWRQKWVVERVLHNNTVNFATDIVRQLRDEEEL